MGGQWEATGGSVGGQWELSGSSVGAHWETQALIVLGGSADLFFTHIPGGFFLSPMEKAATFWSSVRSGFFMSSLLWCIPKKLWSCS